MTRSKEIKAAFIVLGGIFLFLLGFNFLNGTSLFKKENTLYAVYQNVEGLQIGTKVTINGLSVGKVSIIDFMPSTTAILVSFTLRNDIRFSKNSIAELYEAGLIGGKSIAILPVFDNAPLLKEGDTLQSSVKPGLTDVVNQKIEPLQAKLENVLVDADSLFTGINQVLNKEGKENLSKTLSNLSVMVENINKVAVQLESVVGNQKGNLNTTISNFAQVSENLNQITDSLSSVQLKQTMFDLQTTVNHLNVILAGLEQGKGSMGLLLQDEKLYRNIEASTKEVEQLVRDLKEHPKRYVHFSLFGKKEVPYDPEKKN